MFGQFDIIIQYILQKHDFYINVLTCCRQIYDDDINNSATIINQHYRSSQHSDLRCYDTMTGDKHDSQCMTLEPEIK